MNDTWIEWLVLINLIQASFMFIIIKFKVKTAIYCVQDELMKTLSHTIKSK